MIFEITKVYRDQFQFQREHAFGRVLNVGCNDDSALFRATHGNVNIDLFATDEYTGKRNPVHAFADSRRLPFVRAFDSVVLGELLEHMEEADAVQTIGEARAAAKERGRVVITMPHDDRRDRGMEPEIPHDKKWYAPGIYAYHYRCISRDELFGWVERAGLQVLAVARIVYPWGVEGTGAVAC